MSSPSAHDIGDVTAVVSVSARVEVEHPATAGSVVDWVRQELERLGFEDVVIVVGEP